MAKKKPDAPKQTMDQFLAPIRAWRQSVGEERWEEYKREEQTKFVKGIIDAKREFEEFVASDEGKAREELRLGLEKLLKNKTIIKSETCVEVLEAFHHCVNYRWGAKDSGGMIEPMAAHFKSRDAARGGLARSEKQAQEDAPYREFLELHKDKKTEVQKEMLRAKFAIKGSEAHDIVRRWKDSKRVKKSTDARQA